jgi:hypothetical protein
MDRATRPQNTSPTISTCPIEGQDPRPTVAARCRRYCSPTVPLLDTVLLRSGAVASGVAWHVAAKMA